MTSLLDKLASCFTESDIVTNEFRKENYTLEQIELSERKGVFPYEYVRSLKKFKQAQLPVLEDICIVN